jgi:TM2 domain-containing membrane protein YozV
VRRPQAHTGRGIALALLLVIAGISAFTQGKVIDLSNIKINSGADAPTPVSAAGHADYLGKKVEALQAAYAAGDTAKADMLLREAGGYFAQHNIVSHEGLGFALAKQAEAAGRKNDPASTDNALAQLNAAERFAPDLPTIELLRAELAARKGYGGLPSVLSHLYEAEVRYFRNPLSQSARLADWLRPLSDLLLIIGGIFTAFMFWRYNAVWRHDLAELLTDRRDWQMAGAQFAAWAIVLAPLFLLLSVPWLAFYWLLGLFIYFNWHERIATLVLLGAAALWIPVQGYLYARLSALEDPVHEVNLTLHAGSLDLERASQIESQLRGADPGGAGVLLRTIRAGVLLRRGQYPASIAAYQELLAQNKDDASLWNNLGVAYFYKYLDDNADRSALDSAYSFWKQGMELRSPTAGANAIQFNLFLYNNEINNGAKARDFRDAALKDGSLQEHFNRYSSMGKAIPVEVFPSLELTQERALKQVVLPNGRPPANPLDLGANLANPLSIAALLTALAALVSWPLRRKGPFGPRAAFCKKCGDAFCGRCKSQTEYESFCAACVAIFIKQEGVSPNVRMEKNYLVEQAQKFRRITKSVLTLLFPGLGHFYLGQALMGLLLLTLGCCLLIVGLGLRPGLSEAYPVYPLAPQLVRHFFLALYAVFYIATSAHKLMKRE